MDPSMAAVYGYNNGTNSATNGLYPSEHNPSIEVSLHLIKVSTGTFVPRYYSNTVLYLDTYLNASQESWEIRKFVKEIKSADPLLELLRQARRV